MESREDSLLYHYVKKSHVKIQLIVETKSHQIMSKLQILQLLNVFYLQNFRVESDSGWVDIVSKTLHLSYTK